MEQKLDLKAEKKLFEEHGQIQEAVGAIITLIVGVGVAVLVLIFVGVLGGQTYELVEDDIDDIGNNAILNEGFTLLNGTPVRLAHAFIQEGTLSIFNTSDPKAEYSLNNFTVTYDDGLVELVTTSELGNSTLEANYTWGSAEIRESIRSSVISGFSALEQTGDFLPIIVLAVVIFLVLSLVLGFTALGGNQGGGGTAL